MNSGDIDFTEGYVEKEKKMNITSFFLSYHIFSVSL